MAGKKRPGQRQSPGTRTELPESQRAGKPGLAMSEGPKRRCQAANTPSAVLAGTRAPGSCGGPQRLKEAQAEGRNTGAARNSAPFAPARGGVALRLKGGSFGSPNQSWTYFEELESHNHRSTFVQILEPKRVSRRCTRRRQPERNRQGSLCPAALAPRCQLRSQPQRRCCNCLGKWLFYEWEGRALQCARAPSAIL